MSQGTIQIPPHGRTYNGFSRGFNFTSSINFLITKLELPPEAMQAGDTASYLILVNGTEAFRSVGTTGPVTLSPALRINPTDEVDVICNWSASTTGNFSAHNSYGTARAPYASMIEGVAHTLNRVGWQWDVGDANYRNGSRLSPGTGDIGRCIVSTTPPDGLFPGFDATPTSGGQNLSVTFTDTTFSSRPGGVLSRTWDFGDGSTGTGATVTHVYTCGKFSPKLTVTDAQESKSLTKTDLIEAGKLEADFDADRTGGFAPLTVNFTGSSTGSPTAWAWDFGDGGTSTAQNPTHIYTQNGKYTVSLTCSTSCNSATSTKTDYITVGELCFGTDFNANNGGGTNWGNFFDIDVKNPAGLKITAMEVNNWSGTGAVTIDVYTTPGTYVGVDNDASKWSKVATGTNASSQPRNTPTKIDVNDFYLPPGKSGVFVHFTSGAPAYTNGTGCPGNQCYSFPDADLTLGIARSALFGGSRFTPRIWNGTFCVAEDSAAANGPYGYGCAGTGGVTPQVSLSGPPALGSSVTINVTDMVNVPSGFMWLFFGAVDTTGLDLTFLQMPGCRLFANPIVDSFPVVNSGGSFSVTGTIPNNSSLIGARAGMQSANVDAGAAAPLGVAASAGHAFRLGN